MTDTVIQTVIDWISAAQSDQNSVTIAPDTAVAEQQLLDSLQIMDLVMYAEKTFEISVPLDALTEANFATPRAIGAMIHRLK